MIPVEATIRQYDTDIVVWLLGEPTSNPDLAIVPNLHETDIGDEGEELPITGWTVLHKPTRMVVVGVSFTLDDARTFANTIGHLDWSDFRRGKTRAERRDSLHGRVVSAALKGVEWW